LVGDTRLAEVGDSSRPIRNGLSVDVEEYFRAEAISRHLGRQNWDSLESRVIRNTHSVLELLAEHNVKTTFFVLGWVASCFPELVRNIGSLDHEIGCHSYWHRLIDTLSPEEFRTDTRQAKEAIEDAGGMKVIGYRAPTFSITKRSLWALEILSELGFRYDSSIFPTRHASLPLSPGSGLTGCRFERFASASLGTRCIFTRLRRSRDSWLRLVLPSNVWIDSEQSTVSSPFLTATVSPRGDGGGSK